MGENYRSRFGYRLYCQAAVFRALVIEYPEKYAQPFIEYWDVLQRFEQEPDNLLNLMEAQAALSDVYDPHVADFSILFGLAGLLYRTSEGKKPNLDMIKEVVERNYPSIRVILAEDATNGTRKHLFNIERGQKTLPVYEVDFHFRSPPSPRAFDPTKENWQEYCRYLRKEYKPSVMEHFGLRRMPNLERNATWLAWRMVEQLNTNDIAQRWQSHTRRELDPDNDSIEKAINRLQKVLRINAQAEDSVVHFTITVETPKSQV